MELDLDRPARYERVVTAEREAALVPVVIVPQVQIGGFTINQVDVGVLSLPAMFRADGLLGLDILRRFRVTFEFANRILVLRS